MIFPWTLSSDIPSPDDLRRVREHLGLSQEELAQALAFAPQGVRVIRSWEKGEIVKGEMVRPTPTVWAAIRYRLLVHELCLKLISHGIPIDLGDLLPRDTQP